MFPFLPQSPFGYIFYQTSNHQLKTRGSIPYIFNFQSFDFDKADKFTVYQRFLESRLHSTSDKNKYMLIFQSSQKVYNLFKRFYHRHCVKKAVSFNNNQDLNLEPLYNLKKTQRMSILHENTVYQFSIKDLIKLINNSLLEHENFFFTNGLPKNPYNNMKFDITILYSIYFYMVRNNYKIPELFYLFFKAKFNKNRFIRENEMLVRHKAIECYHRQLSNDILYEEIIMLLRSIKGIELYIHIDFPRDNVVKRCLHLLIFYWHSEYELTQKQRDYYKKLFLFNLDDFILCNRNFGRIILRKNSPKTLHSSYKIKNLLSPKIPNFYNLQEVYNFMKEGKLSETINANTSSPDIMIVTDDDDDDEEFEEEITLHMENFDIDSNELD